MTLRYLLTNSLSCLVRYFISEIRIRSATTHLSGNLTSEHIDHISKTARKRPSTSPVTTSCRAYIRCGPTPTLSSLATVPPAITMLPPIPRLEDYGISPERGFMPVDLPLQCLSHPVYDRWERIMNNFQSLLLSKRLRPVIDKLPVLPAVHLETEAEWRRAYTVLTCLTHGYIWGGDKPSEVWFLHVTGKCNVLTCIYSDYRPPSHILFSKSANILKYLQSPHTPH